MDIVNSTTPWLQLGDEIQNLTTTGSTPLVKHYYYYQTWGYKLRISFLGICTIFSLVGNCLSFIVFIKSKIRRTSTGVYLMTLAWADSLYLIMETLVRARVLAISDVSCKITWYLRNVFKLEDAFVIVAICADRMLSFLAPFMSAKYSNMKSATIVVAFVTVISAVLSSYIFKSVIRYGKKKCNFDPFDPNDTMKVTHFTITVVIGEFVTSMVVIAMAIFIVRALSNLRQRARRLSRNQASVSTVDKEVTRMTTAVAIVFSCFRLPYSLVYVPYVYRHMITGIPSSNKIQVGLSAAIEIFSVPYSMNYCVNFFIYIVFWKAFRIKLLEVLRRKFSREGRTTSRTSDTRHPLQANSSFSTTCTQV